LADEVPADHEGPALLPAIRVASGHLRVLGCRRHPM